MIETELAAQRTEASTELDPMSWPMLAVLLVGQFMGLVDVFAVNVAKPEIGVGLHASGASLQLVVVGYTVAYAMLLITGARLGAAAALSMTGYWLALLSVIGGVARITLSRTVLRAKRFATQEEGR